MIRFSFIILAVLLTGCVAPHKSSLGDAGLEPPPAWTHKLGTGAPVEPWLVGFDDPALSAFVAEAMEGSYDLRVALARMEAARARALIAGAERLPVAEATLGAARTEAGDELSTDSSGVMDLGFTVKWELDLWGKLKNRALASLYEFEASRAEFEAARLSLALSVARLYYDTIESGREAELADLSVRSLQKSLAVAESGFQSGIYSALDVRLARASVATATSEYELKRERYSLARGALEVLIGRSPTFSVRVPGELPLLRIAVPVGLPSELLLRRPDLIEAEMRLAATDERLAEARKNILPDVVLTGSAKTSSNTLSELLDIDYLLLKIAAEATEPIYKGGSLKAEVSLAEAETKEALARYAGAVLEAFREVESALSTEGYLLKQERAARVAALESEESERLAMEEYTKGLVDITTILLAQRRSYKAQSALLKLRGRLLQNRLDLCLALGGEFDDQSTVVDLEEKEL